MLGDSAARTRAKARSDPVDLPANLPAAGAACTG